MWPNLIWLLIQRDHMARNVAFHLQFFLWRQKLFILKSGTNKGQWLFTHRLFTTSEHLNPYLSLEWMWWLVLVSGVNKVPDYPTPVGVCTPCNNCLLFFEYGLDVSGGHQWTGTCDPSSDIRTPLFSVFCFIALSCSSIIQCWKQCVMLLAFFSHFRLVNILYWSPCVPGYRISDSAQ